MKDYLTSGKGEPAIAPAEVGSNPSHRILVVDDDSSIRQLNTEVLMDSGYEVDAAADGADAWQVIITNHYDLLITDNNMPGLTGIDLLRKLRSAHMALPVIMATTTLPTHEFTVSPWLIPEATLLKPFTIDELLEKVKAVLCRYATGAGRTEATLRRMAKFPIPDQMAATGPNRAAIR